MAIRGNFSEAGRIPVLPTIVSLPRLGLLARIDFLVDTGAELTVLHPRGAAALKINHRSLTGGVNLSGVGGGGTYAPEFALLAFEEGEGFVYIATTLFIAEPSVTNQGLPSLLGRDMLSHFRMTYDPTNDLLEFDALSFDKRSEASAR